MSNSNELNFQKVCRTCLSTKRLKLLYSNTRHDCLDEMLMTCTSMQYDENDGLPMQICTSCIGKLVLSYKFALKCRESDTKLRTYMQNRSNISNEQSSRMAKSLKDPLESSVFQNELDQNIDVVQHEIDVQVKIEPENSLAEVLPILRFPERIKVENICKTEMDSDSDESDQLATISEEIHEPDTENQNMDVHKPVELHQKQKKQAEKGPNQVRLTITEKIELLHLHEKGEKVMDLAKRFKIKHPSVLYILKKKDEILKTERLLTEQHGNFKRINIVGRERNPLEIRLFNWFLQERKLKQTISGPILCQKALYFNKKIGGPSSFSASKGWLSNFKKRHGIRSFQEKGEKLSDDKKSGLEFSNTVKHLVETKGIKWENVDNADETGLASKA